jgi:hypothetical protein
LIFIEFSAARKFFSRIGLEKSFVLRKKLAAGSVRSQKPPTTPPQTTHKTRVNPTRLKILHSENSQANHSAPISAQASGACKPNAIADKLLNMIAKTAAEVGDIRFSFQVLLTAAMIAEKNQRETLTAEDVASALEKENRIRKLKEIEALRDKLVKQLKKYERN